MNFSANKQQTKPGFNARRRKDGAENEVGFVFCERFPTAAAILSFSLSLKEIEAMPSFNFAAAGSLFHSTCQNKIAD